MFFLELQLFDLPDDLEHGILVDSLDLVLGQELVEDLELVVTD